MTRNVQDEIASEVKNHPVVLFMKGNRRQPMCGFSATVVGVLDELGVPFKDVDVLADPDIRAGIKQFSDWPTVPQLYVNGEFVGGCDIVRDMFQSGELANLIKAQG